MEISFNEKKRAETLEHRSLDFADAIYVFSILHLTIEDDRKNYGERRFQTIGYLKDRMVMVVWTERGTARHIISMRKCNEKEQNRYRVHLDRPG